MPAPSLKVRHYMSPRFVTLQKDQDVTEAIQVFADRNVSGVAVLDQLGNMVGILSVTDCIESALKAGFDAGAHGTIEPLMSTDVRTVDVDDSIVDVAHKFMEGPYRRYPVLEDNRVVGVVARLDVLKALAKVTRSGGAV